MEISQACPVCGKGFSTVTLLDNHFLAEHKELKDGEEANQLIENNVEFACYKCDQQFIEKYQLKMHSRYGCTVNYFCKQCRFKTTTEDYLKEHMHSLHDTIEHCDMCNYKATGPHLLAKHITSKHKGSNMEVEKEIKGKMLKEIESSIWHCTECSYKSKSKHSVYCHVESNHVIHGGHPCHLCSSVAKTKKSLRQHFSKYHKK